MEFILSLGIGILSKFGVELQYLLFFGGVIVQIPRCADFYNSLLLLFHSK